VALSDGPPPAPEARAPLVAEQDFLDRLERIFEHDGAGIYLGEDVTIAEHMLQTAVQARAGGAHDALVAAALLHDVGHLVQPDAAPDDWHRGHEQVAAEFLAGHYGPEVVEPARLHVAAKRYLCAIEPDYTRLLSDASLHTLELQGGIMQPDEVRAFEATPFHAGAVRLRRFEEQGKAIGLAELPTFADFRPLLERLRVDR